MSRILGIGILCLLLSPAVCRADAEELTISKRWHGANTKETSKQNLVICSKEDWEMLWPKITGKVMTSRELPDVDFDKQMVVACFMGKKNSGGYAVKITKVVKEGDEVKVYVREIRPDGKTDSAIKSSSPYHMVLVPKAEGKVSFVEDKDK